eukprot:245067_1
MSIILIWHFLMLYVSSQTPFHVHDLSTIMHPHGHPLFNPIIKSERTFQHDLHVLDDYGKYMKLKYNGTLKQNINILTLNELLGVSVDCSNIFDNIINITLPGIELMQQLHTKIDHFMQSAVNSQYFVIASPNLGCYRTRQHQISSAIFRITSTLRKEQQLIFNVHPNDASFLDLFDSLNVTLKTNHLNHYRSQTKNSRRLYEEDEICKNHKKKFNLCDDADYTLEFESDHDLHPKRAEPKGKKKINWLLDFFKKMGKFFKTLKTKLEHFFKGGIQKALDAVINIWKIAKEIVEITESLIDGTPLDCVYTAQYQLNFNYDDDADHEDDVCNRDMPLLNGKIKCVECYFYADLEYTIEFEINHSKFQKFHADINGDLFMKALLQTTTGDIVDAFYKKMTNELDTGLTFHIGPIPLSLKVAGEYGIGFIFHAEMKYGVEITGHFQRGITWKRHHHPHRYEDPEPDQFFKVKQYEPHTKNWGESFTVGIKTSLGIYLIIHNVGSVHVTLQPHFDTTIERVSGGEAFGQGFLNIFKKKKNEIKCKAYKTYSQTMHIYVGAEIKPLGFKLWSLEKEAVFGHSKKKAVKLHLDISKDEQKEMNSKTKKGKKRGHCVTKDEWKNINLLKSNRRRRLSSNTVADFDYLFEIPYGAMHETWHPAIKWGQNSTVWYGILLLLNETCPDGFYASEQGATHQPTFSPVTSQPTTASPTIEEPTVTPSLQPTLYPTFNPTNSPQMYYDLILPDSGYLFVFSEEQDGDELIATYTVTKEMIQEKGFPITANVTCTTTYLLTKDPNFYPEREKVERYYATVYLDEFGNATDYYHCDYNVSLNDMPF